MAKKALKTTVNGKESPWTVAIQAEWVKRVLPSLQNHHHVTAANYYTPRPYRDEYDRGSVAYGFTYTINGRHVCFVQWEEGA